MKPLGHKAYGSIAHLPGSRMGPADHHCHEGQARICTERARDRHDRIIVTEKLDGSCVAVANIDGEIIPLVRSGYVATTSPFKQHHVFAEWVARQDFTALGVGQRIVGEWMHVAHGTKYQLETPFIAFDVMMKKKRLAHDEAREVFSKCNVRGAHVYSDGLAFSVDDAIKLAGDGLRGHHGAQEAIEGFVWRVERRGEFDFMAKFVRSDKIDGKYLGNCNGNPKDFEVLNETKSNYF